MILALSILLDAYYYCYYDYDDSRSAASMHVFSYVVDKLLPYPIPRLFGR
jgi:hypothetical protein